MSDFSNSGLSDGDTTDPLRTAFSPLPLPCGRVVPNRFVKVSHDVTTHIQHSSPTDTLCQVALYEHLAAFGGGLPNARHHNLYSRWAEGGWGMILTGNVQVARDHLTLGRDIIIPRNLTSCDAFVKLAESIHGSSGRDGQLAIMQLSHAGRQSTLFFGGRPISVPPLAPSPLRVEMKHDGKKTFLSGLVTKQLFQTPREMTLADIDDVVEAFTRGARIAAKSGFDGVELHAAHGYLIASFISPKTNVRTDEYSASKDPLRLLRRIVQSIRAPGVVPDDFVLGIKLNAADYVSDVPTAEEDRAVAHALEIASWDMIDFIEVSGGSYENPAFMGQGQRETIFARFAQRARAEISSSPRVARPPSIVITGGLSAPTQMRAALHNGHADLLGIGRMAVDVPHLPNILKATGGTIPPPPQASLTSRLESASDALLARLWASVPYSIRPQLPMLVGAGAQMAAYQIVLRDLSFVPAGTLPARLPMNFHVADSLKLWWYRAPGEWEALPWVVAVFIGLIVVFFGFVAVPLLSA
ncbi:FMN-linked oxidoreductase [Trametopsis cervina]|nr:FMN-linked oxidoreductase [Trametopsis cervina]